MNKALAVAAALGSLAACKSRAAPPSGTTPPTATDAGAPATAGPDASDDPEAAPDEATLRAGKRTGLAGPDDRPEVATEDLARALIDGQVPWQRFVDPAAGLLELRAAPALGGLPFTRRCGDGIARAIDQQCADMRATLAQTALGYELTCDNGGLAGGGRLASAVCSIDGPSQDLAHDLVFVPDPTRGLRLAGITTITGGVDDTVLDGFDLELALTGPRCP